MSFAFNLCEVFGMAEEIERNAALFYRNAAEKYTSPKAHQTLLELADWAQRHEKSFAEIKNSLSEKECPPTAIDPHGEEALYLRAMVDGRVYDPKTDPCDHNLCGMESRKEVLETAIELEKETLAFYLGLKEYVPTNIGKDKVEVIIKEKMHHIGLLNQKLADLK